MLKWLALVLLSGAAVAGFFVLRERGRDAPPPPPDGVPVASDTFALLVGCTEYPELRKVTDPADYEGVVKLLGPGNDTALMHSVLRRYLGVPEANVRVLAGWPDDPRARPTRANILDHLDQLARDVSKGAHVLFMFAGHGSQQPDAADGDEADGQDEILLPADAGRWDPAVGGVANVITDDEIQGRLLAIRDAGASVWALFDCCHSGTMMRGEPGEPASEGDDLGEVRSRSLPPSILGVPPRSIVASSRGAGVVAGGGVLQDHGRSLERVAAIYAAHSWELAPEMVLPRGRFAADREAHGLCTFQVARALQRYGGSLTIAEVFERVRGAYASMPWGDATPVAEGDLSMRVLPGAGSAGPALLLRREGDARLVLDAGSLRGLTVGSVLEVYRPGGFGDASARLGRVALVEVQPLYAVCGAAPGGPDPSDVPDAAPAEVVEVAPGGPPLRLAFVDVAGNALPDEPVGRLRDLIAPDARARSLFPLGPTTEADWLVRDLPIASDGVARFELAPANVDRGLEPLEADADHLASVLERVRRAENLRGYAQPGPLSRLPEGLEVEAHLRRSGGDEDEPLLPDTAVLPGDRIRIQVTNGTGHDVDVAVKGLDWAQDEYHAWPQGEPSRRLTWQEKEPERLDDLVLTDDGFGRESVLVVVAVRKRGAAALDLGALEGTAVRAGDGIAERQGERALLGALGPEGVASRGAEPTTPESVVITEIAWTSTWGRLDPPALLSASMTPLDAPVRGTGIASSGTPPPGHDTTWQRAVVLSGDGRTADVLLLSAAEDASGDAPFAVFVDEDGDARLPAAGLVEAARRAAAGELPVELVVFSQGGEPWAGYPGSRGDAGLVTVLAPGPFPDRAAQRYDLRPSGWEVRETRGPWLSSAFVPLRGPNPGRQRARVVRAIRRVFGSL